MPGQLTERPDIGRLVVLHVVDLLLEAREEVGVERREELGLVQHAVVRAA